MNPTPNSDDLPAPHLGCSAQRYHAPDGWRYASWKEILAEGFRRVRLITETRYVDDAHEGKPDAGERYPRAWQAQPVRLRTVSRHARIPEYQAEYGDFLAITYDGGPTTHHVNGLHAIALGALVPVDTPRRTVSAIPCPDCGSHDALYATGARTACGACTARRLGWSVDDLPFPLVDDDPVFDPGDVVALNVQGTDGITDTHTGTVTEWTAYLGGPSSYNTEGFRNVRVNFPYGSGPSNCAPAMLRAVEAQPQPTVEVVGGFAVGQVVCYMRYPHERRPDFAARGYVVGFCDDPATGARLVRVTGSLSCTVAASPHRPEHLLTPGAAAGPGPNLR